MVIILIIAAVCIAADCVFDRLDGLHDREQG